MEWTDLFASGISIAQIVLGLVVWNQIAIDKAAAPIFSFDLVMFKNFKRDANGLYGTVTILGC